jgi:hypothetical protein
VEVEKMTPEQEEKLDALILESRDTNSRVRFIESNGTLVNEAVTVVSQRVTAVERVVERLAERELGDLRRHRAPTQSFTDEVTASVGASIGASIAPSMKKTLGPSVIAQVVAGVIMGTAGIAYLLTLLMGHH